MVLKEEDIKYETMVEGEEGEDEGVWIDGEDEPSDYHRYNGEGKKNCCTTREYSEEIFEASNQNTSKVRSITRNAIAH